MPDHFSIVAKRMALGIAIWLSLPLIFLATYVLSFNAPASAIGPHIIVIASLAGVLAIVRYSLYRWVHSSIAIWFGILGASVMLMAMLAYYAVTLAGLLTLGRVISLALLTTYTAQAADLVRVFGVPPLMIAVPPIFAFVAITALLRWLYFHHDWLKPIKDWGSNFFAALTVLLLAAIATLCLLRMLDSGGENTGEPFALMLYPYKGMERIQRHNLISRNRPQRSQASAPTPMAGVERRRINVVLIIVDALRTDHLSLNGYSRPVSPFLDELHKQGRLFSVADMYSTCTESSCGLLSLVSSRYVHQLDKDVLTLHELLRLDGYLVSMILGGDHTNFYGLREAYGTVDRYFDGSMAKGRYMNDDQVLVDHVERLTDFDGQPNFLQFHLMSTHGLGKRDPTLSPFQPERSYYFDLALQQRAKSKEAIEEYINSYDNGVLRTDVIIKELLVALEKKHYLDEALVIITADHGEMLGEHGCLSHAKEPFDPALRIPFLLMRFGYAGQPNIPLGVTGAAVSQVDIAPTVLYELGLKPPGEWSGIPLQVQLTGETQHEYIYFQQGTEYGLIDNRDDSKRWKYWSNSRLRSELAFELLSDPGETINLINDITLERRTEWQARLRLSQATAVDSLSD